MDSCLNVQKIRQRINEEFGDTKVKVLESLVKANVAVANAIAYPAIAESDIDEAIKHLIAARGKLNQGG